MQTLAGNSDCIHPVAAADIDNSAAEPDAAAAVAVVAAIADIAAAVVAVAATAAAVVVAVVDIAADIVAAAAVHTAVVADNSAVAAAAAEGDSVGIAAAAAVVVAVVAIAAVEPADYAETLQEAVAAVVVAMVAVHNRDCTLSAVAVPGSGYTAAAVVAANVAGTDPAELVDSAAAHSFVPLLPAASAQLVLAPNLIPVHSRPDSHCHFHSPWCQCPISGYSSTNPPT